MVIHLRQICLVAEKLAPVIDDLVEVLSIRPCYIDPKIIHFGLENTLLPIGTNFLEVVAPVQEGTAAGRYLERRGGDGGYMVICQTDSAQSQAACRERAVAHNVRIAWETTYGQGGIMQLHPADMRASFLEVDWDTQCAYQGHWHPAGGEGWQDKVATDVVSDMIGVELQGPAPIALAAHWSAVLGAPVTVIDGTPTIALDNARLRFCPDEDGRGPGLGGVDLKVADRPKLLAQAKARGCAVTQDWVMIGGTRFNLFD